MRLIVHYGYTDGPGEYYLTGDTDKCNGYGKCVKRFSQSALELETAFIDIEDKTIASVKKEHRKKIRYICTSCNPESKSVLSV